MDETTKLKQQYLAALDAKISTLEKRIAADQSALHTARQERAALSGEAAPKGISTLGLTIIKTNNRLNRLKRTGASKTEVGKVERELGDLRELLQQQKRGGRA